MNATKPLPTETDLQQERRRNAVAHLRRQYDKLDKLTGKTAAERFEEIRQRRQAC